MPGPVISILLTADTNAATQGIKRVFDGINAQANSLNSALQSASQAITAYLGFSAFKDFVKEAASARQEMAALNALIAKSGQPANEFADALERQRVAMQKLTGVDDDQLVAVQRMLLTYGVQASEMEAMTMRTLDLAAATRQGPVEAARLLGNALAGQAVQIRGLKMELDTTAPKVQQIASFFEQLDKATKGQAIARFQQGVPVLQQISNLVSDIKKELGGLVIDSGILETIKRFLELFKALGTEAKTTAVYVGMTATAFAGLALLGPQITQLAAAFVAMVNALAGGQLVMLLGQIKSLADLKAFFTFPEIWRFSGLVTAIAGVILILQKEWEWLRAVNNEMASGFALEQRNQDFWNDTNDAITKAGASGAISLEQMRALHAEIQAIELARIAGTVGQLQYTRALVDAQKRLNQSSTPQATPTASKAVNVVINRTEIEKAERDAAEALRKAQADTLMLLLDTEHEQRLLSDTDYLAQKRALYAKEANAEQEAFTAALAKNASERERVKNLEYNASDPTSSYEARQKRIIELDKERVDLQSKSTLATEAALQNTVKLEKEGYDLSEKSTAQRLTNEREIYALKLAGIEAEASKLESNPDISDADKKQRLIQLYSQESAEIKKQIDYQNELVATADTDEKRIEAQKELNSVLQQQATITQKLADLQSDTFYGRMRRNIVSISNEWGNLGRSMADVVTGTMTSAISSFSDTLAGVIVGTKSFGAAFLALGQEVVSTLISMTLKALIFRGVMALTGGFFGFADGGLVQGYASGGLINVGTGPRADDVPIMASRGEFVQPASTVRYYGADLMEALRLRAIDRSALAGLYPSGISARRGTGSYADGGQVSGGAGVSVLPAPVNIAVVNNREEFKAFMDKHGSAMAFDYAKKNRHKLGIKS